MQLLKRQISTVSCLSLLPHLTEMNGDLTFSTDRRIMRRW